MVYELEDTDLHTYISSRNGIPIPEKQLIDFFVQICLGLDQIHKAGMVHGNIQTEHVYLTDNEIKLGSIGNPHILSNS